MPQEKHLIKGIKGKIVLALLIACLSLLTAWSVSKSVFKEMLTTVDDFSAPSARLALVNTISRKISGLDQQQKKLAVRDPGNYNTLLNASIQLRKLLDSLSFLYRTDSIQTSRISIIKKLLVERDQQFLDYLQMKNRLTNSAPLSEKVKQLSETALKNKDKTDSTILATEQKTSITTFSPENKKPRTLIDKIFGKKKEDGIKESFTITSEEKIRRDTIAVAAQDSLIKNIELSLKEIESEQQQKNTSFLNREANLINVNNKLTTQMLEVLRMVEGKVLTQIDLNAFEAKKVVKGGIDTITAIFLVFLVVTIILLYFILSDITRSNRYRVELERAKDAAIYHGIAKQRFLANMSHEIRTPLQSILGYTELMMEAKEINKKHIDTIHSSSEHLLQIVNEVLDYNRIISGKFTYFKEPFNMSRILEEVIAIIEPQAEARLLSLHVNFEFFDLPLLNGDSFRLKQVLLNLLANSIKFTQEGEIRLEVKYKESGGNYYFTFVIEDTGIGMSESDLKLIFNEFEQINFQKSHLEKQSGAGLGLTIVKELIQGQGGRIYVKSKLAEGSTFTFYLSFPKVVLPSNKILPLAPEERRAGQVWIVDDDPSIRELCGILLEKAGVNFKIFDSSLEMLKTPLVDDVSHILMDIRMPVLSGEQLCRQMKPRVNGNVKIIAITAQVLPDEHENLLKCGFDELIIKPFKSGQLLRAVGAGIPETTIEEEQEINFEPLKKMTFGDPLLLKRILKRFIEDCREDDLLLRSAISKMENDSVCLILHRMAGRIAQIGASNRASEFRKMELEMRKNRNLQTDGFTKEVFQLLTDLMHMLEKLEKEELDHLIS